MSIAIVGAGWAGLSAAHALRKAGRPVTVFEAAREAGGRARRVDDPVLGAIDNGQHLMLGAYRATLALVNDLNPGVALDALLLRQPLHVETLDGTFRLGCPSLPAPLHTLAGILTAHGARLTDRLGAVRMMAALRLRGWRAPSGVGTVADLLAHYRQSAALREQLWDPLCLAAMNTPAHEASAQVFIAVLRDSLGADRQAGDFILARTDLGALWPEAAGRQAGVRLGVRVSRVEPIAGAVLVDGRPFSACIVAVPPFAAQRLLSATAAGPQSADWLGRLSTFRYRRIATVTLRLARAWSLPRPVMMLMPDAARHQPGQWVIDRHATLRPAPALGELAVVISDAHDIVAADHSALAERIARQVREQAAARAGLAPMPEVIAHRVIVEKRATFDCTPAQWRPANKTPFSGVWIAGDWTDTGLPAVLEGAVRSGQRAARQIIESEI